MYDEKAHTHAFMLLWLPIGSATTPMTSNNYISEKLNLGPRVATPSMSSVDRLESTLPQTIACVPPEAGMTVQSPDVPDLLGPPLPPQGVPLADLEPSRTPVASRPHFAFLQNPSSAPVDSQSLSPIALMYANA